MTMNLISRPDPSGSPKGFSMLELLSIIMKGKLIVLGCLIVVTGLAVYYTLTVKPTYQATSLVLIDMKHKQGSAPFLDLYGLDGANKINNEIETLKSSSLAQAVAASLLKKGFLDGAKTVPIPLLARKDPQQGPLTPEVLAENLMRLVDIAPQKESDVIKVTARSTNPEEAALLANTYTRLYVERNLADSRSRYGAAREFLQEQMDSKHQLLDSTEQQLQTYMRASGMVSLDIEANKVVEQISQLEATRDAIDVELSSSTKTLDSYREELTQLEPNVAKSMEESRDGYISLLQDQLAKLEVQRDLALAQNLGTNAGSAYPQLIKDLDLQIAALKKNLQERIQSSVSSVLPGSSGSGSRNMPTSLLSGLKEKIIEKEIEISGLNARRASLNRVIGDYEQRFDQIPQKSIALAKLRRTQLSTEKLYLMVEQKYNEAAISESSELGYVMIMDPASVPLKPVRPIAWLNIAVGIILGLVLGVGLVLTRAAFDIRISSAEDLRRRGYRVLATVGAFQKKGLQGGKHEGGNLDRRLVAYHHPLSPMAESYRHLRTTIQHAHAQQKMQTVILTSANPGEGKSTTIANLALAFAEAEKRTLLVDADMRRPALHTLFGTRREPGLAEYLSKAATWDAVARHRIEENLDLICAGSYSPNPSALLSSDRLEQFVHGFEDRYDIILLDTPPLQAVSDAIVIAAIADCTILVVAAGETSLPAIEGAYENIKSLGTRPFGIVLNKFNARKALREPYGSDAYGYYRYGYEPSHGSGNGRAKQTTTAL